MQDGDPDAGSRPENDAVLAMLGRLPAASATALRTLAAPHWFNEAVLQALRRAEPSGGWEEAAARLADLGLVETWADGSRAVPASVRRAVLDALAQHDQARHRALSNTFAAIFAGIAADGGDLFDHIESVFHRLASDPGRGGELLLLAGVDLKSEPLFATEAFAALVRAAREQHARAPLPQPARDYLRLLALFAPGGRLPAEDEDRLLDGLLSVGDGAGSEPGILFRAEALLRQGLAKLQLGRTKEAAAAFDSARAGFRRLNSLRGRAGEADALRALGRAALKEDRMAAAQEAFGGARQIYDQLNFGVSAAHCTRSLAEAALYQGRFADAERLFEQSLQGFEATGGHLGEANARVAYAQLLAVRARFDAARDHVGRADAIYRSIDQKLGMANCLKGHGLILFEEGRYADARVKLASAAELYRECGSRSGEAGCYLLSGACETREGRPGTALPLLDASAALCVAIGDVFGEASAHREAALALARLGRADEAQERFSGAAALFARIGNGVEELAARVMEARARAEVGGVEPSERNALRHTAEAGEKLFAEIGYARYLRDAQAASARLRA